MKPHQFAALAILAIISFVAAFIAYSAQTVTSTSIPPGAKLFPGLAASAAGITTIEISQGPRTLTLEKKGEQWLIKERDGFPANPDRVRALLLKLTTTELAEAKTKNKLRYPMLELGDPKRENANSYLIRLLGSEQKPEAEIIIGKTRRNAFGPGKNGSYVRKTDDPQTWLVTREFELGLKLRNWARENLLSLKPKEIKTATVEVAGETPYDIEREENRRNFRLTTIPDGKKIRYENSADDIVENLSKFKIDDVRKARGAASDTSTVSKARFKTDKGLEIEISAQKETDFAWISLTAKGEGETKAKADKLKALADGWEFRIPTSQYGYIFKKYADLLEDKTS